MSAVTRPSLADQQAALVAALTGSGPVPAGFDAVRVRAAADAIAAKRARACAQAWPGLRAQLGLEFRTRFDAYAARVPLSEFGGPLADGRAFVRELAQQLPLGDAVTLQALSVDQRWRTTPRGLVPRSLPRVGLVRLRETRRLVIAIGASELRIPLPRKKSPIAPVNDEHARSLRRDSSLRSE